MFRFFLLLFFCLLLSCITCPGFGQQTGPKATLSLRSALERLENHYEAKLVYLDADIPEVQVKPVMLSGNFEADLNQQIKPWQLLARSISAKQFVLTKGSKNPERKTFKPREFWVEGKVYAADDNIPLEYATVMATASGHIVHTDQHGHFKIGAQINEAIQIAYVGYKTQMLAPKADSLQLIYLSSEQVSLRNIQIFSNTDFIDYIKRADASLDLQKAQIFQTGRTSLPQSLNFSYANINVGHYAIDNVASYLDPIRLNGQDADHIVVLIEGKKRHLFSGLNLNYTTGMGNSGVDLETIPQNLLKTVEVIPADQSLLYGTEAAGGTINFKFDNTFRGWSYRQTTGMTTRGDGLTATSSLLYGTALPWSKAAFFTFSVIYKNQQSTDRSNSYEGLVYRTATDSSTENKRLDDSLVKARNFNRNVSRFGDGKRNNISFWYNTSSPVGKEWKIYSFGGYSSRNVTTYGFYRFPNDDKSSSPLYPDGYLPEDPAKLKDAAVTVGLARKKWNGYELDMSSSYGHNYFQSSTTNTVNPSMGASSPTTFNLGGTSYGQSVNDFSISKIYQPSQGIHLSNLNMGLQFIHSSYQIRAGDPASYLDANPAGTPAADLKLSGTNGHLGFSDANAISGQRDQFSAFARTGFQLDQTTTAGITVRAEKSSDFKANFASSFEIRRNMSSNLSLHASFNRSAKTPSLQQLYFSQAQYQFFPRNGISNVYKILQLNSFSPVRESLGIPALKAEKFTELHFSATYKKDLFSLWLAYSHTKIKDRLLTADLISSGNEEHLKLMAGPDVDAIQFFRNIPSGITNVLQLIGSYDLPLGTGRDDLAFEGHIAYNQTKLNTGNVPYSDPGSQRIFTGIVEDGQPKIKAIAKINYHSGSYNIYLRNTFFGPVWYRDSEAALDQHFGGKVITDIGVSWNKSRALLFTAAFNNLLNIYPDKVVENTDLHTDRTFGNQIVYSRQTSQFGIYGTYISLSMSYKF